MSTIWSSPWRATALGRPFTRWHLLTFGTLSFVSCAWHFFAVVLGWSVADSLLQSIGWITFPFGLVVGLSVVAVAVVLAFRRSFDWRVLLGLLLAATGISVVVLEFLNRLKAMQG